MDFCPLGVLATGVLSTKGFVRGVLSTADFVQ